MTDTPTPQKPSTSSESSSLALLDKAVGYYHGSLADHEGAFAALREAGLADNHLIESQSIGFCAGDLIKILPSEDVAPEIYNDLTRLGILDSDGNESLCGCVTLPLLDADRGTVGIAGYAPSTGAECVIGGHISHIWNLPAATVHAELIAATTIIDGLSLAAAGLPNLISFVGQPAPGDVERLTELGAVSLTLVSASDAARTLSRDLKGIKCQAIELPENVSPSDFLKAHGAEALATAVDAATLVSLDAPGTDAPPKDAAVILTDGFQVVFASRRYELRGIEKGSRRLKAAVRAERQGRLHVDSVDFYSARSRRNLSQDLCRFFEEGREVIDADIDRHIRLCERWIDERPEPDSSPAVTLTDGDCAEARAFGASPDLLRQIQRDYETCGLVGEPCNTLLCYLAAVSRKMSEPLSILILSSSGAGKSALQDATVKFCPPEDVVKLTSMTGKALFYKGRNSLKHKVLALEEEAGIEGAAYPLRALISSGELIIETTTKDLGTGQLTTVQNKVEGPAAVFITTTSPDTDPETRSRFFVTSVDESREQTRRILELQRKRRTLKGQSLSLAEGETIRLHRNFQRLLSPVAVVNPFAEDLSYGDDRLSSRRDQPKLLNLIAAVAFLRQMNKPVKTLKGKQGTQSYIEVDADDLRISEELAGKVLRRSLDDLNPVSFELLGEIRRLVTARVEAATLEGDPPPDPQEISFTRRELREFIGWPHMRVRRYLVELIEMEFVSVTTGKMGRAYRYSLCRDSVQPGQGWSGGGQHLVTPQKKPNVFAPKD